MLQTMHPFFILSMCSLVTTDLLPDAVITMSTLFTTLKKKIKSRSKGHVEKNNNWPLFYVLVNFYYLEAIHASLQSANGIDFRHINNATHGLQTLGTAFAHLSVSAHNHLLPAEHDVRGAFQAINDGLPAGVQVVKSGFDHGVVDVHGWGKEFSGLGHLIQPMDPSYGFLYNSFETVNLQCNVKCVLRRLQRTF